MYDTVLGYAGELFAGDTAHSFGAPVSAHVGELLSAVCEQMSEEHGDAVACIVLCGEHICLAYAVPVERCVHQGFGEVTVGVEVSPLTLSLETSGYGVVSEGFFLESHLAELGVAGHEVAGY